MTTQPSLPGSPDFAEPQTARGAELLTLITAANAAGYRAHRMSVIRQATYKIFFIRNDADETNKQQHTRD
jgi:hypothetical protein